MAYKRICAKNYLFPEQSEIKSHGEQTDSLNGVFSFHICREARTEMIVTWNIPVKQPHQGLVVSMFLTILTHGHIVVSRQILPGVLIIQGGTSHVD